MVANGAFSQNTEEDGNESMPGLSGDPEEDGEDDADVDEYTDDNDPGYVVLDVTDEEFHRLHKVTLFRISWRWRASS